MDILLNELSLHGQFANVGDFQNAIKTVMLARNKIKQFGFELRCHRNLSFAKVTREFNLQQAVKSLDVNQRRALLSWLTKEGPFWDDDRKHNANDYFNYNLSNDIVTDTALGEAAYCCYKKNEIQMFSFESSEWNINPLVVNWHFEETILNIEVINHWNIESIEKKLESSLSAISTWQQLSTDMPKRFSNLTFSKNCFEPLYSQPFVLGAANRIVELLKVLSQVKACFNQQGQRTKEGQTLFQDHFMGDKAWFSDSSQSEKINFKNELTFNNPINENQELFCSWHGKVKSPQIRIHFSNKITASEPLFVTYVGPKITKT